MQDVFQSLSLSLYFCFSLSPPFSACVCAALSTRFKCCSCESRKFRVVFAKFTSLLLLLVMLAGNLFLWHFACANGSALPRFLSLSLTVTPCLFLFTFSLHVLDRDLPKSLWHNTSKATCCRLSLSLFLSFYFCLPPPPSLATPPSNKSELSVKTFEMISLTNRMRKLAPASASVTQLGV